MCGDVLQTPAQGGSMHRGLALVFVSLVLGCDSEEHAVNSVAEEETSCPTPDPAAPFLLQNLSATVTDTYECARSPGVYGPCARYRLTFALEYQGLIGEPWIER